MSIYPHARFLLSVNRLEQLPDDAGAEVAFAGRSNAGKSSAINSIVQRNGLARSSKTPGRTQLINFFELQSSEQLADSVDGSASRRLVDLPGYGYAEVPASVQAHWGQLVGRYLQTRHSLQGLFLIVDSRRGLNEDDRLLLEWARPGGLRVHLLLSKCDKLTRNESRKIVQKTQALLTEGVSVQAFSAVSREGVEEARSALQEMLGKKYPGGEATGAD